MPSAHCDSNGSSGSGDQMPDFDGVHDLDDVGSLLEHNSTDCGQPILMPFQLKPHKNPAHPHTHTQSLTPQSIDSRASQLRSITNQTAANRTLFFIHFSSDQYILMILLTFDFPIERLQRFKTRLIANDVSIFCF